MGKDNVSICISDYCDYQVKMQALTTQAHNGIAQVIDTIVEQKGFTHATKVRLPAIYTQQIYQTRRNSLLLY